MKVNIDFMENDQSIPVSFKGSQPVTMPTDQEYKPNSQMPQSGVAVAQAVKSAKDYTDQEVKKLLEDYPPEDGKDGQDGKDGVSPTVSVSQITNGHKVTITDASGTKTFDVLNGEKGEQGVPGVQGEQGQPGKDGKDGQDGVNGADGKDGKTPYIQNKFWYINGVNTGIRAEGVNGADGKNGTNGTNGKDGVDGISPHIQSGYWYIGTENTGVKAQGVDGTDGKDGKDGYTPVKGVDYYTESERQDIVWDVIASPEIEELKQQADEAHEWAGNAAGDVDALRDEVSGLNGEIAEVKQIAEQAQQDAGSALGDLNTLWNVDLPAFDERITQLENDLGDISSALDELHTYAQNLVNGGTA